MQNDMRGRLTASIETAKKLYEGDVTDLTEAEYTAECLLSEGVITLPCNVGDTVYLANEYYHCDAEIEQIVINENGISFEYVQYDRGVDTVEVWDDGEFSIEDIGTKVYLTLEDKETAETDLIKMEVE